jgi:predicted phosphodiesterase
MLTVLAIGDPHFKDSNAQDTDMMAAKIAAIALETKPDITVILGDMSDSFNNITIGMMQRMNDCLSTVQSLSKHLYLMIGNHDRRNNHVYMTEEHPFGTLKKWDRTTVVDTTVVSTHLDSEGVERKFVFVPYVPPGKLDTALQTKGMGIDTVDDPNGLGGVMLVCTHQEYKDMKMGAIKSKSDDVWPSNAPPCVNGHIHDYDLYQPNLRNIGAPIQGGFKDRGGRTISLFTFENGVLKDEKRFNLGLPPKISITLTPQELANGYTPPTGAQVRITVKGPVSVVNSVMGMESVKALAATIGIKIIPDTTPDNQPKDVSMLKVRTNVDFQTRVVDIIGKQPTKYRNLFMSLTGVQLPEEIVPTLLAGETTLVIA